LHPFPDSNVSSFLNLDNAFAVLRYIYEKSKEIQV
jgi:hypothetical protein